MRYNLPSHLAVSETVMTKMATYDDDDHYDNDDEDDDDG